MGLDFRKTSGSSVENGSRREVIGKPVLGGKKKKSSKEKSLK